MCLGLCKCAGHSRGDADPRQPRPPLGTGAAAGARVPPRVRRHRGCQLVCVALLRVFPPDRRHVAEDTPSCVAFLALLTSPDPVVKVLVSPIEPSVSCCAAFLVQWQCSHLVAPKYLAISDKCVHKNPFGFRQEVSQAARKETDKDPAERAGAILRSIMAENYLKNCFRLFRHFSLK